MLGRLRATSTFRGRKTLKDNNNMSEAHIRKPRGTPADGGVLSVLRIRIQIEFGVLSEGQQRRKYWWRMADGSVGSMQSPCIGATEKAALSTNGAHGESNPVQVKPTKHSQTDDCRNYLFMQHFSHPHPRQFLPYRV
jgi:hypothetical protein